MINRIIVLIVLSFSIISCGDNFGTVKQKRETTFYLIRHAEKDRSNPDEQNPNLTAKGIERSIHWASYFDSIPLNSIYTTNYNRTKETITPVSESKGITPKIYSPNELDIEQFIQANYGKSVLISGHSNTTPNMVNKILGEEKFSDMSDSDNKSLFVIKVVDSKTNIQIRSVVLKQ